MKRQKYRQVALCRWTRSALNNKRNCYKSIYGVKSHRCLQMTPVPNLCTFSCEFCWRKFEKNKSKNEYDSPDSLLDKMLKEQKRLLSGFGGNPNTPKKVLKEAMSPAYVAISLDGEPTIYPYLPNLIKEINSRGATSFLVTNGTLPKKIKELIKNKALPNTLLISVYATNPEDYKKITNSFIKNPLKKVIESLKLMKSLKDIRTDFRMTLVKGLNLKDAKGYSKLIKIAQPKFISIKGFSLLGDSKKTLKMENMPSMSELNDFANQIKKYTKYLIKRKDKISRVIILVKDEETWLWNKEKIKEQNQRIRNILL